MEHVMADVLVVGVLPYQDSSRRKRLGESCRSHKRYDRKNPLPDSVYLV